MSANTDIHRELLPNYTNVLRDHIKSYRHFQRVNKTMVNTFFRLYIKQYWHFQSCYKKILHTFFRVHFKQILSGLLPDNTSHQTILTLSEGFYKVIIHIFPEFISTNYRNYQTIFTLSKRYYQKIVKTFFNAETFRELLPNNSKHSLQSSYQTILTLSKSFFKTLLQNKISLEFLANHTDTFRALLINTTGHNLLNTLTWNISNQAIFNESCKT